MKPLSTKKKIDPHITKIENSTHAYVAAEMLDAH